MEQFNRKAFAESLAKLQSIGAVCWKAQTPDFAKARDALLHQAALKDEAAAQAFGYVFGEAFIGETNKAVLNEFGTALSFWVTNFVNLHQYRLATLKNNCRIGATYFAELEQSFVGRRAAECFRTIRAFLDSLVEEIIANKEYLQK